jgi:aminoglycoside phosphotransferase (APT) family kinase protein
VEGLRERIEAFLSRETGRGVRVSEVAPLGGGACQDLFRVDLADSGTEGSPRALVLRSDARTSLPGSLDRRAEYAVVRAAVRAGVPTPEAVWLSEGLVREGAFAYFMPRIEGEAVGARVTRHPSLAKARESLPEALAAALARVHSIVPETEPDLPLPGRGRDPADHALAGLRGLLDALPDPQPALELAFAWLDRRRPGPGDVTLLHGDFRTGNFLVGPEGLAAVLDWEFARWGDPLDDVAWLCVRDWRFGVLDRPAGGLATRERFHRAYEAASGRRVDPERVTFWEVLGNVRWAAGAVLQAWRALSGGSANLEHLAIGRRVSEMAFEALRLIEVADAG